MYKGVVELNAIGNKGIATLFDEVFDLICCTDTEIDIVSQIMEGEVEDLLKARDNTCQKRINVEKSLIFFDNNKQRATMPLLRAIKSKTNKALKSKNAKILRKNLNDLKEKIVREYPTKCKEKPTNRKRVNVVTRGIRECAESIIAMDME